MKKTVFIIVCILGIFCLLSCRSTSQPCGLADTSINNQTTLKQVDLL